MLEYKRVFSRILSLFMVFILFFSIFCISMKSGHDCTQRSCPVCSAIQTCVQMLNATGMTSSAHTILLVFLQLLALIPLTLGFVQISHTLVSLKVKLSN